MSSRYDENTQLMLTLHIPACFATRSGANFRPQTGQGMRPPSTGRPKSLKRVKEVGCGEGVQGKLTSQKKPARLKHQAISQEKMLALKVPWEYAALQCELEGSIGGLAVSSEGTLLASQHASPCMPSYDGAANA